LKAGALGRGEEVSATGPHEYGIGFGPHALFGRPAFCGFDRLNSKKSWQLPKTEKFPKASDSNLVPAKMS
jgi:hypothetical protein